MVNINSDKKFSILNCLKNSTSPVSGEELSRITGISRVGVWKHIKRLKEHGYEINSNHSGYLLETGSDLLQPWEFPDLKNEISFFAETDSTMLRAKEMARKGAPDRSIVVAETQTGGKGRKDRKWESEKGGLYFTIILRPDIPLNYYNLLTLSTAVGINSYFETLIPESRCKWPNDILIGNKKISGILTEISGTSDRIEYALIGIGININNRSEGISLKDALKKDVPREQVLDSVLKSIFKIYDSDLSDIPSMWNSKSSFRKTKIKYRINSRIIEGRCRSVTREGNLLLETDTGKNEIIFPGDERIA